MKRKISTYTIEFKKQAVALAKELGTSRAADQLGTSPVNIYEWKKKFDPPSAQTHDNSLEISAVERDELTRLRKEVSELKKVNHILKSAAAFFSQDHLK